MEGSLQALKEALAFYDRVHRAHLAYLTAVPPDPETEKTIRESIPPGLYENWKSKEGDLKFYLVHGAGYEKDGPNPFVAFRALYRPHAGHLAFWHLTHAKHGFLIPIDCAAYMGPRFKLILPLNRHEIETLLQYVGELKMMEKRVEFLRHVCRLLMKEEELARLLLQ